MDSLFFFIIFLLLFFDETRNIISRQILKIIFQISPILFLYEVFSILKLSITFYSIAKLFFLIYFFIIWKPNYIPELEGLYFKFIQIKENGYGSIKIYGDLSKSNKTKVFGVFPHGPHLYSIMFLSKKFYDLSINKKIVCAPNLLKLPFARQFLNSCFDCTTADKQVMINHLIKGENLLMYPGGVRDMFYTLEYPNKTVINVSKITTLIQMMKNHNTNIVPIVIFNEYDHIYHSTLITKFFKYIHYNIFKSGILTPPMAKTTILGFNIYLPLACNLEPIVMAIGNEIEISKYESDFDSKQKIKNEIIRIWKNHMKEVGKTLDDLVIL